MGNSSWLDIVGWKPQLLRYRITCRPHGRSYARWPCPPALAGGTPHVFKFDGQNCSDTTDSADMSLAERALKRRRRERACEVKIHGFTLCYTDIEHV